MRAIGVDLGTKRIGIALSAGTLATPFDVVVRSGDRARDHRRIAELADEAEADVVVVGLPRSLDGSIGPGPRAATPPIPSGPWPRSTSSPEPWAARSRRGTSGSPP